MSQVLPKTKKLNENDLLHKPQLPICNWSEDHWNLRLFHTIKTALPGISIKFTAKRKLNFVAFQNELSGQM